MSTQTRVITADEFLVRPDEPGFRQELIREEVVTRPQPGGRHGRVALKIGRLVGNHVEGADLGETYAAETGFIVEHDPDTVRGADFSFVARERLPLISNEEKHIPFAPELAVEVRSPSDRDVEVEEKVQLWLAAGSQLVWVVDPEAESSSCTDRGPSPSPCEKFRRSTAAM
jgi:Uma2 family endonuclease